MAAKNQDQKAREIPITLDFPIMVSGIETDRLKLRRPKLKDREAAAAAKKDDEAQVKFLIGNLLGLSPAEFSEIDLSDYMQIQEEYLSFFPQAVKS